MHKLNSQLHNHCQNFEVDYRSSTDKSGSTTCILLCHSILTARLSPSYLTCQIFATSTNVILDLPQCSTHKNKTLPSISI